MKMNLPNSRENSRRISEYMADTFQHRFSRFNSQDDLKKSPTLLLKEYPRFIDTKNGNLVSNIFVGLWFKT
jgi:hypothetical protein